jgi:hypothetical protein
MLHWILGARLSKKAYKKPVVLKINSETHIVSRKKLFYSSNVTGVILQQKLLPVSV